MKLRRAPPLRATDETPVAGMSKATPRKEFAVAYFQEFS
jgi:hypothetical protein